MFEGIIPENEIKFNDLDKKIFKLVCIFGCLILKLMLEAYDRKLMNARGTKKNIGIKDLEEIQQKQ